MARSRLPISRHNNRRFIRKFHLSGASSGWTFCRTLPLRSTTKSSRSLYGRRRRQRRILFDMPEKKVMFAVPSPSEQACNAIGSLLHGSVAEKSGEMYLKVQLIKNLGPGQSPWVRIVSVNGHKGSGLFSMLKEKDQL